MQFYVFGGIIAKIVKNKKIIIPSGKNIAFLVFYLISFIVVEFYAIDKGMNLLGFFKNLSILFFIILVVQYDNNTNKRLSLIPYVASASLILSLFLTLFPENKIFMDGRLQGIFEYANSYGLFLLIGIVVLTHKEKIGWKDYIIFGLLALGIILTNSRAIILLSIFSLIVCCFINKKNLKSTFFMLIGIIVLFGLVYSFSKIEKRVNTEMLESSEFTTRLLYYTDAVNMIKSNPFGYGYDGWYYKQAEVKTGVYDTKYVHNSVLQLMLDVGIIPTIVVILMMIFIFFDKKQNALNRLIMILILGHSLIDIDLEYIYFLLILLLFADFNKKEIALSDNKKRICYSLMAICTVFYFMIFLSDLNFASKNYKTAVSIIPFNTEAIQETLYTVTSKEEQIKYAQEALKYNEIVSGAYEALSNELQEKGEYLNALKLEEKRLSYNKYSMHFYMSYAEFLTKGFNYYSKQKENDKADIFLEKLLGIEDIMNEVIAKTNPLCYKTIHAPELEMNEALQDLVNRAQMLKRS